MKEGREVVMSCPDFEPRTARFPTTGPIHGGSVESQQVFGYMRVYTMTLLSLALCHPVLSWDCCLQTEHELCSELYWEETRNEKYALSCCQAASTVKTNILDHQDLPHFCYF